MKILISVLISLALSAGAWFGIIEPQRLGVEIPATVALFESSLASKITSSATSMTLVSGTMKNGSTLSGKFGFVIDEGGSDEEFVIADCVSTACTNMLRGIDVADGKTEVATLKHEHRRGASVKMTDFPILVTLQRLASGSESFEDHLYYSETLSTAFSSVTASTSAFTPRLYVDAMAASGFTAANINSGDGMQVYGTSPETLGINLASSSGLYFLPTGDLAIYPSASMGISTDDWGRLFVNASDSFDWTGTNTFSGTNTFTGTLEFSTTASTSILTLDTALDELYGGLGTASWDKYDILYADADNQIGNIASGSDSFTLGMRGGVPTMASPLGAWTTLVGSGSSNSTPVTASYDGFIVVDNDSLSTGTFGETVYTEANGSGGTGTVRCHAGSFTISANNLVSSCTIPIHKNEAVYVIINGSGGSYIIYYIPFSN